MKIDVRKLSCVIAIFIYIYIPPLFPHATIVWGCMFLAICLVNHRRTKKMVNIRMIIVWGSACGICLWSILASARYGGIVDSIKALSSEIYLLLFVPVAVAAILVMVQKYDFSRYEVWKMIIFAGIMQTIVSLFAYLFTPFQTVLCHFLQNIMSIEDISWWRNYRLYGLSCSLTFAMPVAQALIGGLCFLYAENYDSKFYWAVPFIWISGIINARVAIVVILIEILIWGFDRILGCNGRIKKSLLLVVAVSSFILLGLISLIMTGQLVIPRLTEPVLEILSVLKGTYKPRTHGYISYFFSNPRALKFPKGAQLFWGGGIFNNTSDVGYIMHLWLGGAIFSFCVYFFYFRLLKRWHKTFIYDKKMKVVVWVFGLTLFTVNIKGDAFLFIGDFLNLFFLGIGIADLFYMKDKACYKGKANYER